MGLFGNPRHLFVDREASIKHKSFGKYSGGYSGLPAGREIDQIIAGIIFTVIFAGFCAIPIAVAIKVHSILDIVFFGSLSVLAIYGLVKMVVDEFRK